MSSLRRTLLISALTAVLTPVAFGGLLMGASALAESGDAAKFQDSTQKPPPPPKPHRNLSALGRASAVAWINAGHLGH